MRSLIIGGLVSALLWTSFACSSGPVAEVSHDAVTGEGQDGAGDAPTDADSHDGTSDEVSTTPEADDVASISDTSSFSDTRPDSDDNDDAADGDPGNDVEPDTNACGGTGPLIFDGVVTMPGESCGCDGTLACDTGSALRCVGGTPANACGGCQPLGNAVGVSCGDCGQGTWTCDAGTLSCLGDVPVNACGGCAELPGEPAALCDGDDGLGVWVCNGTAELLCRAGTNGCGGDRMLEASPGTPCGACLGGTWVCSGRDAVVCRNAENRVNACGGCDSLSASPGTSCECGGTWVCGESGAVVCEGSVRNACGGCSTLSGLQGEVCGSCDTGRLACDGPNALQCNGDAGAVALNACGGCGPLDRAVGVRCGVCQTGVTACDGSEAIECAGDQGAAALNACGGCARLASAPGSPCGPCGLDVVQCVNDGEAATCSGATECGPVFATAAPQLAGPTELSVSAMVERLGSRPVVDHGFCLGPFASPRPGQADVMCTALGAGVTEGEFGTSFRGLEPGGIYHVAAWLETAVGRQYAASLDGSLPISAPVGVTASDDETAGIALAWAPVDGAGRYEVQIVGTEIWVPVGSDPEWLDADAPLGELAAGAYAPSDDLVAAVEVVELVPPALAPAASRRYRVRACNDICSPASAEVEGQRALGPVSTTVEYLDTTTGRWVAALDVPGGPWMVEPSAGTEFSLRVTNRAAGAPMTRAEGLSGALYRDCEPGSLAEPVLQGTVADCAPPGRALPLSRAKWLVSRAGTFVMGAPETDGARDTDEPQRTVVLTHDTMMMRHEVTWIEAESLGMVGTRASAGAPPETGPPYAQSPAVNVTYIAALHFANRWSELVGLPTCYRFPAVGCSNVGSPSMRCPSFTVTSASGNPVDCPGYRLPTEAEWERAYRAGTTTRFPEGDSSGDLDGCGDVTADLTAVHCASGLTEVAEYGLRRANAWEFVDMGGNAEEWVSDRYTSLAESAGQTLIDPYITPGTSRLVVVRGGSVLSPAADVRASARTSADWNTAAVTRGFRLARTIERGRPDGLCGNRQIDEGEACDGTRFSEPGRRTFSAVCSSDCSTIVSVPVGSEVSLLVTSEGRGTVAIEDPSGPTVVTSFDRLRFGVNRTPLLAGLAIDQPECVVLETRPSGTLQPGDPFEFRLIAVWSAVDSVFWQWPSNRRAESPSLPFVAESYCGGFVPGANRLF